MATLTIHNLPDDLLERLERSARENGRSIEDEVVVWLKSRSSDSDQVPESTSPDPFLEIARAHRKSMPNVYITEEEVNRYKREGRL